MSNGWTLERRQRQAQLIKQWQPWTKSTGAKTPKGKKRSSRNAFKNGGVTAELKKLKKLMKEQKEFCGIF